MKVLIRIMILLVVLHEVKVQYTKKKPTTIPRVQRNTGARLSLRGALYLAAVRELSQHTTPWYERYSPWMGYEPYWLGGDWIFDYHTTPFVEYKIFNWLLGYIVGTTRIPTSPIYVCGKPCEASYRALGEVCGLNYGTYWFLWYDSYHPKTVKREYPYRTFATYCDYLATNCRLEVAERYGLVHLGRCLPDREVYLQTYYNWYKPIDNQGLSSRIFFYFKDIYSRWNAASLSFPFDLTEPYSSTPSGYQYAMQWIKNKIASVVSWDWMG